MRLHVGRGVQQTSFDIHQISKVGHAVLVHPERGQQHRQHRTPDDCRFDERSRAQADDGLAEREGIEVVGLG